MRDKLKRLSKDTFIYGLSTIISRFLNFLLVPLYTNVFAPNIFSDVAVIYSYIAILNVVMSLGFESGFFRFYALSEDAYKKQNFSLPYITIFANALVVCSLMYFFSDSLTGFLQIRPENSYLLKYTAAILFFDAITLIPFGYLRLKSKAVKFGTIKVINIIVNVGLNLLLIFNFKLGIESIFISNLAASIVTFMLLIPQVAANLELVLSRQLWIEIAKFSLPYIPAGISSNIVQVIDRPIMRYLTDETTTGVYQMNYRLGIFMMLFVAMFEFAWRPFFLQHAKDDNAKELYSKVMTFSLLGLSFLFIIVSVFVNEIATLKLPFRGYVLGEKYWSGLYIVPVILYAYVLYGAYINLMAGIYIEKKTSYLPFITGAAAVTNIIINFTLIPVIGIMGGAVSTLCSYLIMLIGIYIVSQKFYKINYEYGKLLKIFITTLVTYVIYLSSTTFAGEHWYIGLVCILIFLFMIITMNVVPYKTFSTVTQRFR